MLRYCREKSTDLLVLEMVEQATIRGKHQGRNGRLQNENYEMLTMASPKWPHL